MKTKYYRWYPYNFCKITEISKDIYDSLDINVYSFTVSSNGTQTITFKPHIKYKDFMELINNAHFN